MSITASVVATIAKVISGSSVRWVGCQPDTCQRVYFANQIAIHGEQPAPATAELMVQVEVVLNAGIQPPLSLTTAQARFRPKVRGSSIPA